MNSHWKQLLLINVIAWLCLAVAVYLHSLWLGTGDYLVWHAMLIALVLALVSLFDGLSRS